MFVQLQDMSNKQVEQYTGLFSETYNKNRAKGKPLPNKKRKERRKIKCAKQSKTRLEANKKHIKNLSDKELTNDQINLLAKGLKFIPTPVTKQLQIRRQLLRDFNQFTRRMCLQYIFHGENNEPHPFFVLSNEGINFKNCVSSSYGCFIGNFEIL